jgi:hypothetical protein
MQAKFDSLSPLMQHVLQILALCEDEVGLRSIIEMLKHGGWADADTKSGFVTQVILRPELNKLYDQQIIARSDAACRCVEIRSRWQDFCTQQAVLKGNFATIVEATELDISKRFRVRSS